MVWILNHRIVLGDIQKTCNCFFFLEKKKLVCRISCLCEQGWKTCTYRILIRKLL